MTPHFQKTTQLPKANRLVDPVGSPSWSTFWELWAKWGYERKLVWKGVCSVGCKRILSQNRLHCPHLLRFWTLVAVWGNQFSGKETVWTFVRPTLVGGSETWAASPRHCLITFVVGSFWVSSIFSCKQNNIYIYIYFAGGLFQVDELLVWNSIGW